MRSSRNTFCCYTMGEGQRLQQAQLFGQHKQQVPCGQSAAQSACSPPRHTAAPSCVLMPYTAALSDARSPPYLHTPCLAHVLGKWRAIEMDPALASTMGPAARVVTPDAVALAQHGSSAQCSSGHSAATCCLVPLLLCNPFRSRGSCLGPFEARRDGRPGFFCVHTGVKNFVSAGTPQNTGGKRWQFLQK